MKETKIFTKLGNDYYKILEIHGYYGLLGGVRERVVDDLDLKNGMKILDIGSGDGLFAITFSKKLSNSEVIGIDVDEENILDAIEHAETAKAKCKFLKMNAYELSFPDKYFDVVGCFLGLGEICHSIDDVAKILDKVKRVLKRNGQVILCDLMRNRIGKEERLLMKILEEMGFTFFKKLDLTKILKSVGSSVKFKSYDTNLHLKSREALVFLDHYGLKSVHNWRSIWRKYKLLIEKYSLKIKIGCLYGRKE